MKKEINFTPKGNFWINWPYEYICQVKIPLKIFRYIRFQNVLGGDAHVVVRSITGNQYRFRLPKSLVNGLCNYFKQYECNVVTYCLKRKSYTAWVMVYKNHTRGEIEF